MEHLKWILVAVSSLLAIKLLLIPTYRSTDFDVHRNWMAITHNLKLPKWYYEDTSEWTLDYPPFFAYFELFLAKIAETLGLQDILVVQKEPLDNINVLLFQRLSVITCDFLYIAAVAYLCFYSPNVWNHLPRQIVSKAQFSLFVLLVTNVGLLLVDNIHFQYNNLLTTLLIVSLTKAESGHFLKAAFVYSTLLNFKHIYIYYAPAFVFYYLHQYFDLWRDFCVKQTAIKGVSLLSCIVVPVIFSFGPFVYFGGFALVQQIISRLFPISRGLTHAYWAPNFWALYNFADLILYRVFTFLKLETKTLPTYNSGLVKEHSHAVLPCITTTISFFAVICSLIPLVLIFLKKRKTEFSLYLTLSSLSFFYFGYHVHEKALLLITIPLIVLAFKNPVYIPVSVLFSSITTFSLFPLLFTIFEIPIKYSLGSIYFLLMLICIRQVFGIKMSFIVSKKSAAVIVILFIIELYGTFCHKIIFGDRLPFLPLMLISIFNAAGITGCYFWIVKLAIEDGYLLYWKKKKCEIIEELIRSSAYSVQSIESMEEVKIIGGVDISTSKTNPQFAVVCLTILDFPTLKVLATYEEIVFITEPYITDYLAIREANPISSVIRNFMHKNSALRPDVILCDGNGRFHSRGCGIACHIGARSGIATIGIAKSLNISLLKACNASNKVIEEANKLIDSISKNETDGFLPFDIIKPPIMNIVKLGGSKVPVFVSVGYGIELDLATEITMKCAKNRICEPIKLADSISREKVRELFD